VAILSACICHKARDNIKAQDPWRSPLSDGDLRASSTPCPVLMEVSAFAVSASVVALLGGWQGGLMSALGH
jgi:hypothetical protein